MPHLHVHLVPRPTDDARAGGPLESEAFDPHVTAEVPADELRAEADELRALLALR